MRKKPIAKTYTEYVESENDIFFGRLFVPADIFAA
jgi:hypothetical protein